MVSNHRSPLWPYLLVLSGLFLLSLAVPRGWRDDSSGPTAARRTVANRSRPTSRNSTPVAVVRPVAELSPSPAPSRMPSDDSNSVVDQQAEGPMAHRVVEGFAVGELLAENVARRIADLRRFGLPESLWQNGLLSGDTWKLNENTKGLVADDSASSQPQSQQGVESQQTDSLADSHWPLPHSLMDQLDRLSHSTECQDWAIRVKDLCIKLCQTSPDDTQAAGSIVLQLQTLVDRAEPLAATLGQGRTAEELRRARYALERRISLWDSALAAGRRTAIFANVTPGEQQRRHLKQALSEADAWMGSIPHADGWRRYLLLDELAPLADAEQPLSTDATRRLARQALQRLSPLQANESQRQVLANRTLHALAEQLRPWALEPIDVRHVLAVVEDYEATGLPSDARRVVAAQKKLKWSAAPADQQLSQRLDEHYRNANLRVSLSADILNRLAPEQLTATGVVNDTILGAVVRGRSESKAHLQVKLIPDSSRLHFWVEADGVVDAQTQATRGPATFSALGESTFQVRKEIILDRQGWNTTAASGQASSNSELTGVRTELDGVPILGGLARNRATAKEEKRHEAAEREMDQRVALRAEERLNADVERALELTEQSLRRHLLAPLAKLELNVDLISLETAAQRGTARLRLSGAQQLGGHTARPQAPSDSLASFQVHETAINNGLDQLQLAGRRFTLPELVSHLEHRIDWPSVGTPENLPPNVVIGFAGSDPLRVRLVNGVVRLTIAIASLDDGKRLWHDFSVTAVYEPQLDGLQVRLARQGAIELGGDTYKGQPEVVLRGIFSKILPREQTIDLVPAVVVSHPRLADLCITQCALEDGWLGLAVGHDRSVVRSSVATRPAATTQR